MTRRPAAFLAVLALAAAQTGQAGQNPVTTAPLVFIPPVVLPGIGDATAGGLLGAGPPDADAAGAGAAAGAAALPDDTPADAADAAAGAAADAAEGGTGTAGTAADTASRITQVTELCRDLPDRAYTIDCVAAGLADIANSLPRTGDRAAARAALSDAARNLRDLALANRSRSLPRATVRRGDVATSRPVVPVTPSPETDAAAAAIVAQAQTVLLRSAPNAGAVPEYNRISAALDTTRVLLRSG